jgi:hypothetical protein
MVIVGSDMATKFTQKQDGQRLDWTPQVKPPKSDHPGRASLEVRKSGEKRFETVVWAGRR